MIQFACPNCGKKYKVSDDSSGRRLKCRACEHTVQVPNAAVPFHPTHASSSLVESPSVSPRKSSKTSLPWARWLAECEERIGEAPRTFDAKTTKYISFAEGWIYGLLFFFPICRLLKNSTQRRIFRDGQIVWGHIIQANGALWNPSQKADGEDGMDDAVGELVFSLDDSGRITPEYLEPIAVELGSLRDEESVDEELQPIADYLAAENVRVYGRSVPPRFTPRVACYISSTMFVRRHLPNGYLQRPFLPLIVVNRPPYFVMPLPAKFWSRELLAWWTDDWDQAS